MHLPFENWQSCSSLRCRRFQHSPQLHYYKQSEYLVSADFKQPPFRNEEVSNFFSLSRNVEASTRSPFNQEHKLPEEKHNSLGLMKFRISARHLSDSFRIGKEAGLVESRPPGQRALRHFRSCEPSQPPQYFFAKNSVTSLQSGFLATR